MPTCTKFRNVAFWTCRRQDQCKMDVTNGLLSSLVKTRSIQRVLAPIASQISLLIILNESEDGSLMHLGEMVPCAKLVMQASHKLVCVAKHQASISSDQELVSGMVSACEMLDLASANLYVASERLEASHASREARAKLVQASKDVLQGTMKVLLVADDAEIRRLVTATNIVTEKLSNLDTTPNMHDLVHRFKEFTEALSMVIQLADRRQRDITQSRQRERIVTSLNILKKSIASLSVALQNAVKYSQNPQAQLGKSYVIHEIQSAMTEIMNAVQNQHAETDDEDILQEPGLFVTTIEKALEGLSVEKRDDLDLDLEMWTEEAVRHSMTVAHLCLDKHRDVIIATCQRVIQVKSRVILLHRDVTNNQEDQHIREEYNDMCEQLADDFCDLETSVNVSLLHLVVDHLRETTQPLDRLVQKALHAKTGAGVLRTDDECIDQFVDHAEKLCQIALLAAASSTVARRVAVIRSGVRRLERLDPEIVPAVIALSHKPADPALTRHVKLLISEWTLELTTVLQVMDEMTDPKMFILVSERKVEEDINTCNGCVLISDQPGFVLMVRSIVGRSRRVAQVAERIVDAHDDPLFRNGLMVFVQNLKKAITGVQQAGDSVSVKLSAGADLDQLRRRFEQLQDCLYHVKMGLSENHHPDILDPQRRQARPHTQPKEASADTGRSEIRTSRPGTSHHGIIATSLPRLGLSSSTVRDDMVQAQTITSLSADMPKTTSLGNMKKVPKTYAWRLAEDLVTWATKGDKQRVNRLCNSVLGWTNHIADTCQSVLVLCTDGNKKRDMESNCAGVDECTPELIDSAKYVLHGDFSHLDTMKTQADCWATKVEKVRVYVDVTVETWKEVSDKVVQAASSLKPDLVTHLLEIVEGHYTALSDLVTLTERMRSEVKDKGREKVEALWDMRNDLENVTVTFKTTAAMVAEPDISEEDVHLEQLGREWSVCVHTMVTTVQQLCEDLLQMASGRRLWPGLTAAVTSPRRSDQDSGEKGGVATGGVATGDDGRLHQSAAQRLVEYLQEENKNMKHLMSSACFGDEARKVQYKDLLADMWDCVEDIKSSMMRKANTGVMLHSAGLYCRLRLGLHRGQWICKAIKCVDIATGNTRVYAARVDTLIEKAFAVRSSLDDSDQHKEEFEGLCAQFTDTVSVVKRRVLSGIQLSAELGKRSAVRQCLDAVGLLAPKLVTLVKTLAEDTGSGCHSDMIWHRLLWCAKAYHLVTCLGQISDAKPTLATDIGNLLNPSGQSPSKDDVLARLTSPVTPTCSPEMSRHHSSSQKLMPSNGNSADGQPFSKQSTKSHDLHVTESHDSGPKSHDHGSGTNGAKNRNNVQNGNPASFSTPGGFKLSGSGLPNFSKVPDSKVLMNSGRRLMFMDDPVGADARTEMFEPVVVNLDDLEEQIKITSSGPLQSTATGNPEKSSSPTKGAVSMDNKAEEKVATMTTRNDPPIAKPLSELLDEAEYIERETERWTDEDNMIVKVARTMATQIHQMTLYVRQQGPIKTHLGLVQTAKAMAENSDKILQFAKVLAKHCVDKSFSQELLSYCLQVPLVRQQLMILANVQMGTATTDTADRILVQNAQNLMRKVLQTVAACEAVCVKGVSSEGVSSEADRAAFLLATRWRQRHLAHRLESSQGRQLDDLGLRVMEGDDRPPALTQIFTP